VQTTQLLAVDVTAAKAGGGGGALDVWELAVLGTLLARRSRRRARRVAGG
jgi:hypothetical protein